MTEWQADGQSWRLRESAYTSGYTSTYCEDSPFMMGGAAAAYMDALDKGINKDKEQFRHMQKAFDELDAAGKGDVRYVVIRVNHITSSDEGVLHSAELYVPHMYASIFQPILDDFASFFTSLSRSSEDMSRFPFIVKSLPGCTGWDGYTSGAAVDKVVPDRVIRSFEFTY